MKFNSDGTYEFLRLETTSPTTANEYLQTGIYTSTSNQITQTAREATCSAAVPVCTVEYSLEGANLVLSGASGSVIYQPDAAMDSSNLAFTYGCFSQAGFTRSPLGPVSN